MIPAPLAPVVYGAMNIASATGIVFANKSGNFEFWTALDLFLSLLIDSLAVNLQYSASSISHLHTLSPLYILL